MPQMRSIWKGHIRFSLVTIPIRIYNAVDTAQSVSFNQLHKEDYGRIGYEKRCKKCGKKVSNDEIVKGFQYEPDQYAVFEKEELDQLKLKSTKVIEIQGFVDAAEIDATLYDAPYFAGPDGDVATGPYALLANALKDTGKMGVGKVVLRDREDIVMIAPEGDGLLLYKMRYPKEIRNIEDVPLVEPRKTSKQELELARSLVDSMTTSMDDLELENRYGEAVREMVEAKIEGKEVVVAEEEEKEVVDIMTALKESIEQARGRKKPMEKVSSARARSRAKAKTKSKGKTKKKSKTKAKAKKKKTA